MKNLGIEEKIDKIIKASLDIFYYAIVLAEFYKGDEKPNLESALSWKFNTYLKEFTELTRVEYGEKYGRKQILEHLRLLSLIQPLKESDLKNLENLSWDFPINVDKSLFGKLKKVGKGLIFEDEGGISIKPDPLADYVRFEWFEKERKNFEKTVFKLLEFAPYRFLKMSIIFGR